MPEAKDPMTQQGSMDKVKRSYKIKRQNDYITSRWVLLVYKGVGRDKQLDTWYFTTTRFGAVIRQKLYKVLELL